MYGMLLWSDFLCFSQNPPSCCTPPSTRAPSGRSTIHRLSSLSDSSPLLVGQLLSSESSPSQPGVMSLTQPVDPTHSLSFRHLNLIPLHFKDENISMSLLVEIQIWPWTPKGLRQWRPLRCSVGRKSCDRIVGTQWTRILGGQEAQIRFIWAALRVLQSLYLLGEENRCIQKLLPFHYLHLWLLQRILSQIECLYSGEIPRVQKLLVKMAL